MHRKTDTRCRVLNASQRVRGAHFGDAPRTIVRCQVCNGASMSMGNERTARVAAVAARADTAEAVISALESAATALQEQNQENISRVLSAWEAVQDALRADSAELDAAVERLRAVLAELTCDD